MAKPKRNVLDSIEYYVIKIGLLLLALVGIVKVLLMELKSIFF